MVSWRVSEFTVFLSARGWDENALGSPKPQRQLSTYSPQKCPAHSRCAAPGSPLPPSDPEWQGSQQKSAFSGALSRGAVPKWHLATWGWHGTQDSKARKGAVLAGILKPPEFQPKQGGRGAAKLCTNCLQERMEAASGPNPASSRSVKSLSLMPEE